MQLYANSYSLALREEGVRVGVLPEGATLDWVSPLHGDRYTEYRDSDFLEQMSLSQHAATLRDYWPTGGPCWDGLAHWARNRESGVLLFEAKSYPGEAHSRMMARAGSSIERINKALALTSTWLRLEATPPTWFSEFYQTANRLAHLYFLREMCGLDAGLVFLLVVEDPTHRPTTRDEWEVAWPLMWDRMGLPGPPPHTHAVLIPGLKRSAFTGGDRII
jgi:hypothetical protein